MTTCTAVIDGRHEWVHEGAFSPDGAHIACVRADGSLCVHETVSGKLVCAVASPFRLGPKHYYARQSYITRDRRPLVWSPSGQYVAAGGLDGIIVARVALTERDCASLLFTVPGHAVEVHTLSLSPCSTRLLYCEKASTLPQTLHLRYWDPAVDGPASLPVFCRARDHPTVSKRDCKWEPKGAASACRICGREFSLIARRHHVCIVPILLVFPLRFSSLPFV